VLCTTFLAHVRSSEAVAAIGATIVSNGSGLTTSILPRPRCATTFAATPATSLPYSTAHEIGRVTEAVIGLLLALCVLFPDLRKVAKLFARLLGRGKCGGSNAVLLVTARAIAFTQTGTAHTCCCPGHCTRWYWYGAKYGCCG
jgi:hypothetical protein